MDMKKRDFLAAGLGLGAGLAAVAGAAQAEPAKPTGKPPAGLEDVKVIVFDTFGSVVNWRGSFIKYLTPWGEREGIKADWGLFIDTWRNKYYGPEMGWVRSGKIPWTDLETLFSMTLEVVLPTQPGLAKITEAQKKHIMSIWRTLDPWPDSVAGLTRLKSKYIIGPLSNGSVAQLAFMAKNGGIPWDNIFATELWHHYKGDKETYLGVVELMQLQPHEVMMGAAHNWDLRNAASHGLKTAFWPRPMEHGPGQTSDLKAEFNHDIIATDIEDFARQMGV